MGFFNDLLVHAFKSGSYYCPKCGGKMFFENEETRDVLICEDCNHDMDIDHYGLSEEEYDDLYPSLFDLDNNHNDDEDDDY